jgi:ABC-2 type transport system permease protein
VRSIYGAVVAVVVREFTRFLRQHGRLVSTFARPLLWLVVVGAGFERIIPTEGTVSYLQFLLPGIFGMVILFSTMLSALSTVHDREFGPIRMLLVAPVQRWVAVVAKTVSSTLLGVFQALLLLPLIWILGLRPTPVQLLQLLGAFVLCALALSTVGMVIASRVRSIENFAGVMNFLMFPMFFLSSALYPAELLPGFLQPFVRADPLTYGIDLMRDALLSGLYVGNFGSNYTSRYDIAVLLAMSIVLFALSVLLFGEEDHLGRILLVDKPRGPKRSTASLRSRLVRRPSGAPAANGTEPVLTPAGHAPGPRDPGKKPVDDPAVGVEGLSTPHTHTAQ